ncbi:MAG: hypothetical protein HIU86_13320 [Acidobacteria bacterium]|nr:hypothetical protein [Acidobacteriota bacterium]
MLVTADAPPLQRVPGPAPVRARMPWWSAALLLYAGSRVVSTALIELTMVVARPGSRIGQHAQLLDVLTAWDGQWYRLIAASGYPSALPVNHAGVAQNAWAFLPLFPWLARALSLGVPSLWPIAAVLLSTVAGAIAAVLLGALVRPHVGDRGAVITVALFVLSPVAFLLEAAYAESLSLALLFGVLLLVDRRRHLTAIPLVVALAFTRPGLQAVALAIALTHAIRVLRARRDRRPVPAREWAGAVVLAVVAAVGGEVWPWIAAAVTGAPDAYLATEVSWRSTWTGSTSFVPVVSWFEGADFWFGPVAGPVVLAVLAAAWMAILLSRPAARAGRTVRVWSLAWTVYLLAVFFPQSSTFRLLMPMAPIGAVLASARTRVVVGVLLSSVALQGIWIFCIYGYWTHFWTVP